MNEGKYRFLIDPVHKNLRRCGQHMWIRRALLAYRLLRSHAKKDARRATNVTEVLEERSRSRNRIEVQHWAFRDTPSGSAEDWCSKETSISARTATPEINTLLGTKQQTTALRRFGPTDQRPHRDEDEPAK